MTIPAMIAVWFFCANAHSQTVPANAISHQDPKALQDLLSLSDQQLQSKINTDWNGVRATLDLFRPAQTASRLTRQGFAGPQQACLQRRSVPACRAYMGELISLHNQRQGGSLLANPWTPAAQ